ncbi:MAG TPA: DUF5668 domain-containing protein [Chitinophaga sp.]|uniref:LiaF transmembrane domain-containing protein n=1 Tax=Chitinophaga sp. TaxID=1869181 RepID=UPI002BAB5A1A|nr:DUF5668 domain-containing protein [Chitinophaga sp.]HVI45665.1 DUF5668 domain-containing protein [Chitinophaga sp.]
MKNEDIIASRRRSRGFGGLILIIVGVCLLLQKMDLDIPNWVFSWQMLLIGIGLLVGLKHRFMGSAWLIMISVGGIFLAGEIMDWPYNSARFIWPLVLIVIGIAVVFNRHRHDDEDRKDMFTSVFARDLGGDPSVGEDSINVSAMFSGVNKVIVSKDFKGGQVSTICGGVDLNFMKADINGRVELEITTIMGGCELLVPSNWTVKVDIITIMGGVEDKRPVTLMNNDKDKVLVLKGSCTFGGVEIKSY